MLFMLPPGLLLAAAAGLSDLAGSALVLSGRNGLRKRFDAILAFGLGFVSPSRWESSWPRRSRSAGGTCSGLRPGLDCFSWWTARGRDLDWG